MDNAIDRRGLPQNLEAERVVLAAVMKREEDYSLVASALELHDFSLEKHRLIWSAIGEVFDSGKRVDRITVVGVLRDRSQLESVDGISYIADLDEQLPTIYDVESYVRMVKDKSVLRRAVVAAHRLIQDASVSHDAPAQLLDRAERLLRDLSAEQIQGGTLETSHQVIAGIGLDRLLNPQDDPSISTPWPQLNGMIGGFREGQLIVIGARPGVGKTAMAMQISTHACEQGIGTVLYSLEMSKIELIHRLICGRAGIDSRRFRQGLISPSERNLLAEWARWLAALPLWIDDSAGSSIASIHAAVRRLKARREIGLIVVDYLGLITTPGRSENRTQEVSQISRGLKRMAKEFGVPVIAPAQLNRDSERNNRAPSLPDLRESGSIEQDADTVIFLHKVDQKGDMPINAPGETQVIVAKQRSGPLGRITLRFNGIQARFDTQAEALGYGS